MSDILPFVQCLVCLDPTTLRRLVVIVSAVLAMTGRVTMLGISGWTEDQGGAIGRTVQRFFNTKIDWDKVHWLFVQYWFIELNVGLKASLPHPSRNQKRRRKGQGGPRAARTRTKKMWNYRPICSLFKKC